MRTGRSDWIDELSRYRIHRLDDDSSCSAPRAERRASARANAATKSAGRLVRDECEGRAGVTHGQRQGKSLFTEATTPEAASLRRSTSHFQSRCRCPAAEESVP